MAPDTSAPAREERSEARARELADMLTWQLDDIASDRDSALKSALFAWSEQYGYEANDDAWQIVRLLTGGGHKEDQPASATTLVNACLRLLLGLDRAMGSHAHSGGFSDVPWAVAYAWIVEMREAQADIASALDTIEADAARRV